MGKIPNGIAPHILYVMDGRIWIENSYAASKTLERQIERGYAHRIDPELIRELVIKTLNDKE